MKILIVNDDGIEAKGLHSLAKQLCQQHEVCVVAPMQQRSGFSHAVTLHAPLHYEEVPAEGYRAYRLEGTPCDCVKFAYLQWMHDADLVISGINDTVNVGDDILYSGTINAAIEGGLCGVPSMAVSVDVVDDDYEWVSAFVANNLSVLLSMCKGDQILSVNFPSSKAEDIKGLCVAPAGIKRFDDYYVLVDGLYYLKGEPIPADNAPNCDVNQLKLGNIVLTPIRYQYTDEARLAALEGQAGKLCW